MPDAHGRTTSDEALDLLRQAEGEMRQARELVEGKPTKAKRRQAFRLLSGVESKCATLKIAIDPWD